MEPAPKPQRVCHKEAIDLLNCATQNPYDQAKCLDLLQTLRQCVLNQKVKKFTLAGPDEGKANTSGVNEV